MKYDFYASSYIADDLSIFEFTSTGRHGAIKKRIIFSKTDWIGVYNLAFGDVDQMNTFNDQAISNNGDRNKILATIVRAIDRYTRRYPRRWIYFCGNTKEKVRLYRIAISLNLDEFSNEYEIFVQIAGKDNFLPFEKNTEVQAFLIRRRIYA